ncbi:transketolase [bacterium]|nr:transketolase [bacterium]
MNEKVKELQIIATQIRIDIIQMLVQAGSGHSGGSLSCADILACLYFSIMRHNPKDPHWKERDRFILSKGHACPALYAALAEAGYFKKEELLTLRKLNSILQGHPDMNKTPGVEFSSGSLGQGFAAAFGMALGYKLDKNPGRIFVLLGDGECQEGIVWETAMGASHYGLDNLTAILDYNNLQIDGKVSEIMEIAPIAEKFRAFGWTTYEIDGHDIEQILWALSPERIVEGKPTMVIARTVKGKGVSFMENEVDWHGKAPSPQEAERALAELYKQLEELKGNGRADS